MAIRFICKSMSFLTACLLLAFLPGCSNEETVAPDEKRPVLSAVPESFVQGGSTTFTVTSGQNNVTADAIITEIASGQKVQGSTWTSETVGTYKFIADYNNLKSDTVTITVTEASEIPVTFSPSFGTEDKTNRPGEIGVFAAITGESGWSDSNKPDFFCKLSLEQSKEDWTYDPVQMWPKNSNVSFFAYAPHASQTNGLSVSDETKPGMPVLKYAMPSATEGHTNIYLATPQLDRTQSQTPVELKFRSVMSKVGFRIKGQGEKITKIAVRGIQSKGEIALNGEDQGSSTWSLTSDFPTTEYEVKLNYDQGQNYVTATKTMTGVTAEDGFLYLIPQNLTFNARIVVWVDGDKLGFPFDDVFQLLPGQEYIIDLVIPGDKPLDYTDNAMPSFLIAPIDAAEASNISWVDAKKKCEATGYRLPTYNEGLMILFYMNGIENNNFRYASYWALTTSLEDPTGQSAMGYNIMPWMGLYMPKAGITAARCVRSAPKGGKKYPYIDTTNPNGPIIVSRDKEGGVIPSAYSPAYGADLYVFHDKWRTTPDHDGGTQDDKISRKLQISNTNATNSKVVWNEFSCPDGWRKPTMMEMAFIYTMSGAVKTSYDADNAPVTDTPLYEIAGFTPLNADYYWVASMAGGRGGRNPATWSFASTPRNGGGTINGPDANYVRCVRDIE